MKINLVSIALAGIVLSGAAVGMEFDPKFYVGGEAQYNKLKNDKVLVDKLNNNKSLLRKNTPGAGLFLGTKLTENFGAELGYAALGKSSRNDRVDNKWTVKMHNTYVDALGYIPVADDVDIMGAVGAGRLSTKLQSRKPDNTLVELSEKDSKSAKTKTGLRLGLGAQYKFDSNFGARMIRHQKGNKIVKNVNSAGVGLFYQF